MLGSLVTNGLRGRRDVAVRRSSIVRSDVRSIGIVPRRTSGHPAGRSSSGAKRRLASALDGSAHGLLRLETNEGHRGPIARRCVEASFMVENSRVRGLELVSVERGVSLGTVIRRTFHSYVRGCRDGCNILIMGRRGGGRITSLFSS